MPKVAAIQMTSTISVDENLTIAQRLIEEAARQDSQLVVLPEMFPILGTDSTDKIKVSEEFGAGKIQDFLAQTAKQNHLWIVGGTLPLKTDHPDKISAASLVFDHHGTLQGRYDKIHLFDVVIAENESYQESQTTKPGREIVLIDTPCGKLGLSVCYDIRFPELYRKLFLLGAEIFAIPAAFTVKTGQAHWEILARSRAIENLSYVVGACQSGTHQNGRQTYGHSLIVNAWGEIIAQKTDGIGCIVAEVNLEKLKTIRKNMPIDQHLRLF